MRKKMVFRAVGLLSAVAAASCGAEDPEAPVPEQPGAAASLSERLDALSVPAAAGAAGPGVAALHEYLGRYGYFPNADLAARYPAWRPVVTEPPRASDVFDERTSDAVRALQRSTGLFETGVVDEPTLAILKAQRCSMPDGIVPADASSKFAVQGSMWATRNLTWSFLSSTGTPIPSGGLTAAAVAFSRWRAQTDLDFTRDNPFIGDIAIDFRPLINAPLTITNPPGPGSGGDIVLNASMPWSTSVATPGRYDMETVLLHEIGHALGLLDSSIPGATMYPIFTAGTADRTLDIDDNAGISSLYDTWKPLGGCAWDIGVGADGTAWVIGCSSGVNGVLYRWSGTSWERDATGGAGVRVDVGPNGIPWITEATGRIFRRSSNSVTTGSWIELGGCARDIGVSSDGSVWVVGCGSPDGLLHRWNGAGWDADTKGGVGVAVTVDSTGLPWIINSAGQIFQRSSVQPGGGQWRLVPGNRLGTDIGVGASNYAWMVGVNPVFGGREIYAWDAQSAFSTAPAVATWIRGLGAAIRTDVGPNARAWFVDDSGAIFIATR